MRNEKGRNFQKPLAAWEELRSIEDDFENDAEIEVIIDKNIKGYTINPDKKRGLKGAISKEIKDNLNDNPKFSEFCRNVNLKRESLLGGFDVFEWLECHCSDSEMEFREIFMKWKLFQFPMFHSIL